ncbi:Uncharacterised protein [Pseudomonas aeruginosa]|nr:Uncharacterised protein [Pseudomonas aeruginosa]
MAGIGRPSRWPGSRLARLPVSRPPMAFGWPVRENGPHPARPILPVARCRLISALFLALPVLDWLSPMHQSERKRGERPIHSGAALQVGAVDAADVGDGGRGVVAHQFLQVGETLGMLGDERTVDPVLPEQDMQDAVEQCDVGAGQQRQVQVGQLAGVGAPRVDHHDAHLRPSGLGGFQATEQDRVGEGHVAAGDQHAIGAVEVFVAARRCVGAPGCACSRPPPRTCTGANCCRCCWCRPGPAPAC